MSRPRSPLGLMLAGLLCGSACASTPRIELSTAAAAETAVAERPARTDSTAVGDMTGGDPAGGDGDDASTDALGVDAAVVDDATTPTTDPAESELGLLAGGVDPATLVTTADGGIAVQPTPEVLRDRRLTAASPLAPPGDDRFVSSVEPLEGDPLRRSTWNALCPVATEDLRYVTVAFWGFDGGHHRGELIVAAAEAEAVVSVFERLHTLRFPIEEMRIVTPSDVVARQTGDGNNTASFVCRLVTGGSRFSEHAYGLAIDINPFHNPYQRDEVVIPSLASSYLDRSEPLPGMIVPGDPRGDEVVAAFAAIGWSWGGDWSSLKDYQHFAKHNR